MSNNKHIITFSSKSKNNANNNKNSSVETECYQQPMKCDDCGCEKNNTIYIAGVGWITYCSSVCYRNLQ